MNPKHGYFERPKVLCIRSTPPAPVEAIIALSILFVAWEVLRKTTNPNMVLDSRVGSMRQDCPRHKLAGLHHRYQRRAA